MSQSKFSSVADYEFGLEISARWGPLVEAAGFNIDGQSPMTTYLLAGSIMKRMDARVCAAASQHVPAPAAETDEFGINPNEWEPQPGYGPVDLVLAMSKQERAELRASVLAYWGKK